MNHHVLMSTGLLQTTYYLNDSFTKRVEVGLYPTQIGKSYSLLIRFIEDGSVMNMSYEDFSCFSMHFVGVNECIRTDDVLNLSFNKIFKLHVNPKKNISVKDGSAGTRFVLSMSEWNVFMILSTAIQHALQHLYINLANYQDYISSSLTAGEYVLPQNGLEPYNCERIFCELQLHGNAL